MVHVPYSFGSALLGKGCRRNRFVSCHRRARARSTGDPHPQGLPVPEDLPPPFPTAKAAPRLAVVLHCPAKPGDLAVEVIRLGSSAIRTSHPENHPQIKFDIS